MPVSLSRLFIAVTHLFVTLLILCAAANAQQNKGDKEIMFFSGGFFISVDETDFKTANLSGTGAIAQTSGFRSFAVGGKFGYFLTRRHEIGGGTSLAVYRFKFCVRTFEDGRITSENCEPDTYFAMSLGGFYRFHFAQEGARRFFFVGADVAAGGITRNYTGNLVARPHVGYRYFLNKKVALDFSVGYTAELNKRDESFFARDREGSINGQFSLSFVF